MDMIEDMFREPTEDEIAEAQLEEHIKWLNQIESKTLEAEKKNEGE